MGQPDLAVNSLTSHADVFADIINAIIYEGRTVLNETCLKPFYVNSAVSKQGKLKGLYRDTCMEDTRNGIRYVIWGIENQYVDDLTTPFKIMGYDFTAYDKQIEEFMRHNKQNGRDAYVQQLHFDQKLKPVVTLVLYYGTKNIPDNICALMEMPEDTCVKRYIQNYHLNVIRLHTLTPAQAALFQSDFAHIAKFLAKSYNKKEQIEYLMNSKQTVVHLSLIHI